MAQFDLLDRKLVYSLDFHARMPLSILAKKLHISKQVVKYRIENLEKRSIITGFYADVNPSRLGYAIYLIYLKFAGITPEIEKEFVAHITKQDSVGMSASINGTWDFSFGIWATSVIQFKNIYRNIMDNYEKYVKSKNIMIETDFYYFKPKQILEEISEEQIEMSEEQQNMRLDNTDNSILRTLSQNSRTTLIEMAQKTGLTANAIKDRIKKLEKNKIILAYRVFINYQQLGYLHYRIFLHLTNITEEKEKKIIHYLKYQKETISATKTIGYCEIEFRAIVKNINEFYALMTKIRNQFIEITEYESIIYHKFYKTLNYYPFKK